MPRILSIPRTDAVALPLEGCWAWDDFASLPEPLWRERAEVEHDESLLQLIPYVVLRNAAGELWCYARKGGDARLDGRWSCGVGGHVEEIDAAPDIRRTLCNTAQREMAEELAIEPGTQPTLNQAALIYEGHSPIGRVHLGVLFIADWANAAPPSPAPGEALRGIGFLPPAAIVADPRFELWSRLAAGFVAPPSRCDNLSKEPSHDPPTAATGTTPDYLARTASRRSQPEGGVSTADSQHDRQFDGTRTRASGCSPSATASDSTSSLVVSQLDSQGCSVGAGLPAKDVPEAPISRASPLLHPVVSA